MKAFTLYPKGEIDLRQLLRSLQDYGELNCDFVTFTKLYEEWHTKTFPGVPVNTGSATFRNDWLIEFVTFLANKDI